VYRAAVAGVVAAVAATMAADVGAAPTNVLDKTYSCRVRAQRYVDLAASVTLPPVQNLPQPATVGITTVKKGIERNGSTYYVPNVFFQAGKRSLRIDRSVCRRSSRRAALKPTGLPTPPETATPSFLGRVDGRCASAKRVLVHLRLTLQNGKPEKALFALRNDDRKRKPLAFYRWSPRKVTGYLGQSCVSSG
jgi:hypothetical protein